MIHLSNLFVFVLLIWVWRFLLAFIEWNGSYGRTMFTIWYVLTMMGILWSF